MTRQKKLNFLTASYKQAAVVFPFIMVSPAYFANAVQLGGLMQTANAFGQVQDALSVFVEIYRNLAEWRAVIERLNGFDQSVMAARALAMTPPVIAVKPSEGAGVSFKELAVRLPNGVPLVNASDIAIEPGERVLVSGPSGSGKSTLFRALAGVWPFGAGTIVVPKNAKLMILPQRPYFPIAPFAAAIAYPAEPGTFDVTKVAELITAVGLPALASRIEEEAHWNRAVARRQQRLNRPRILHRVICSRRGTASLTVSGDALPPRQRLAGDHLSIGTARRSPRSTAAGSASPATATAPARQPHAGECSRAIKGRRLVEERRPRDRLKVVYFRSTP